mmetsp:Transcript_19450/g.45305  ORF Transcript_19450/g.45305 Transcript_19450/m.45305 type:complete len:284 (+) Transcript_19450:113-964(+)|eukprot:CAMPEP_0197180084 /NCGR_PEP_ID=MMETSP1423-20130617/4822_1 /TAXON_ID=476441 /ORGANISM="Pseudo-nitzschia heimii, Strain UNC1101" /LENGTH=283 /DNA_ID=CAMNT_0042630105 /DNA_START=53 /DNA_END=904 /DNA_ORIENTATION=-
MGSSISAAEAVAKKQEDQLKVLMDILETKRKEFIERIELQRGDDANNVGKEVAGGRTISRISEIRVATNSGADPGIALAIGDFLSYAQGGDNAKQAAVDGTKALISSGLNALFGAGSATGFEKEGFVVIFLNYSFVRIDYFVYTYSIEGAKWGAVANRSGSCYVCDISVLDPTRKEVRASEIDYLLGQSLSVPTPKPGTPVNPDAEFYIILKMKIQLVESMILSRLLDKDDLTLDQLREYTIQLIKTQELIAQSFNSLADFVGDDFKPPVPSKPPAASSGNGR